MQNQPYDDLLSCLPNIPAACGGGLGDAVIQTHLPKNIYRKYGTKSKIWCPNHLWDIWEHNPYVEEIIRKSYQPFERLGGLMIPSFEGAVNYCTSWAAFYNIEDAKPKGDLYVSEQEKEWADKKISLLNPQAHFRVAMQAYGEKHAGLSIAEWNELAKGLQSNSNFAFQVGYNRSGLYDLDVCQELRYDYDNFPNWHGENSPRPLMAIINAADLYLGVDTGGMHIATALGKQVIELSNEFEMICGWIYQQNINILVGSHCHRECCHKFPQLSIEEIVTKVEQLKARRSPNLLHSVLV